MVVPHLSVAERAARGRAARREVPRSSHADFSPAPHRPDPVALLESQAADYLQADITHFGGILETKKLAAWAENYYVLMAPHNVGGAISTAAALHFAASTPNFKIQEHFNDFADEWVKSVAPGNPEVVDGYFALPQGPGLGVTLDPDRIAHLASLELRESPFYDEIKGDAPSVGQIF